MEIVVEMACSINGIIADQNGEEEFLDERNYAILMEFLRDYDCLVWGNVTFKNVLSWGSEYMEGLKDKTVIIFSNSDNFSTYDKVIYCNGLESFKEICDVRGLKKIFVSGGAKINNLFLANDLVDRIIINYNPCVINKGINLFEGEYCLKKLSLEKIKREENDIVQIWYKVRK